MLAAMNRAIAMACAATTALLAMTANAAGLDLDKIAGLYVTHFQNGDVGGDKFWSDNVLELVKVSPDTAFFRTHLEFYNGHECELSGVAEISGASLVYRDPRQQCELHIDVADGKIAFDDRDYHCREASCGARGGYSGATFALKSRRPIGYMQRLLASSEYRDAVKEYAARHWE